MQHRILVTGGAGFIGSNFIEYLLQEDPSTYIVNLDALTYAGKMENIPRQNENHIFVKGNITDKKTVTEIIEKHNLNGIINIAAESHVDKSIENPNVFIDSNITGTLTLLQTALKTNIKRFLQISTDEVYGSISKGKFTENSQIKPSSPYSASKASADHLVSAFNTTYNLNTIITRCTNNYGPKQLNEKLIPIIITNALQNKPVYIYGSGSQVRDWIYVTDHCSAIWKSYLYGRSGNVYNVGSNNEKTNLQIVKTILNKLNKPETLILHTTDRPGHDERYAINSNKLRKELGWKPLMKFEEGLQKTIDYYVNLHK